MFNRPSCFDINYTLAVALIKDVSLFACYNLSTTASFIENNMLMFWLHM